MHYSFDPIALSSTSITIAITSITCIATSTPEQFPSLPSPSPSRLSHALQFQSYRNVHHRRHHVYLMHYRFSPITMSFAIAITSITCITVSILQQCPSPSPSRLSYAIQLQSYYNVRKYRNHVYHIHYSFNPITMSITSIIVGITSITCITASIQ